MGRTIFAVVALLLAGGIFYFYTKPTYDSIQAKQAQVAQYNTQLNEVAQTQKLAQTLTTQYNSLDPNALNRLQELLPDHVDNIGLILDLNNMAAKYGMPLENVQVNTPNQSTSASAQSGSDTIQGGSSQKYNSLTLQFSTKGTYESFNSLLNDLQDSLRIVDLVSLSLTDDGSSSGTSTVYDYAITVRTYWLP